MSEHQTYKAKSTSLVVMLLLFFAGMGNKTWKALHLPGEFNPVAAFKGIAPKLIAADTNQKTIVYNTPKALADSLKIDLPQRPQKIGNKEKETIEEPQVPVTVAAFIAFAKNPALKIEPSASEEEELATLTKELDEQNSFIFNTGFPVSDSIKKKQKNNTDPEKLLENTGSNYFNSEVQPIMNDLIKSVYTTRLLYDSVITTNNKDFAYNTLTINNTTASKLIIQVIITGPQGWQMITSNTVDIVLDPLASTIIPMRFIPSGNNTATWQQVRIEYRLNNTVDTRKNFFKIKVQEYAGFKASLPNSNLVLTGYQKNGTIPILIKNSGNTQGDYKITLDNQLLKLGIKIDLNLNPGKDTTLFVPFNLSESQFSMLKKEDIRVAVANEKKETINLIQSISKVGYLLKDHTSAYLDMPLQLEAGAMYQGAETPIQYYGALFGSLDFDPDNHLSMSLRSNTIAKGQTNDNSMVRFDFTGKHIQASVGNVQGAGEFMVDGYGARLGYQWKTTNKAEVFGMLKSRVGDTKVFGAASQIALRDNLNISDAFSASIDNVSKKNSGILSQVTELKLNKGRFALITGVGMEENNAALTDGTETKLTGTSLGYNFQWANKHIAAVSNVLYNSNSYPGSFKGQRLQMHDIRWLIKNNFIGSYYEYNFRKQNYWQDTLLFTNVFNLRTTNYGVKAGGSIKGSSLVLAAGNQKQLQEGTENFQTIYNYLNLNFSTVIAKKIFLNITSFGGELSSAGDGPKEKVFVSTTQGNLQYKAFGASFRYDNGPYYYQEFAAYIDNPQSYERIIFSPFAEVHLLKKTLNARFQGNYAKTLPSDVSSSSVLANINYSHPRGYDFNINGIVPIGGDGGGNSYLSASFRMRLKAPFIAIRKYYNLKLVLFKDINNNGSKDAGEEPIAGQTLSLNGDLFVSDGNGLVIYKNTEKGMYKADFGYSSKLKGWIPNDGTIQNFELNGNKNIEVPYKVSRVLSGKLIVEKDSLSNSSFSPNNIKVVATGDKGEVYSTLTDENGEFYFNLPSGSYIVTLSDVAFTEQFRPVQFSQPADLINNQTKELYFEIKQKRRQINIKRK